MIDVNSNDKANKVYSQILSYTKSNELPKLKLLIKDIEDSVIKYFIYLASKYKSSGSSINNVPLQEVYNYLLRSRPISLFVTNARKEFSEGLTDSARWLLEYIASYLDASNPNKFHPFTDKFLKLYSKYGISNFYLNNHKLLFATIGTESFAASVGTNYIIINVICNTMNTNDLDLSTLDAMLKHEMAHIKTPNYSDKLSKAMSRSNSDSSHSSPYLQRIEGKVDELAFRDLDNDTVKNTYRAMNNMYRSTIGSGISNVESSRLNAYRRARFRSGFMGRDRDGSEIRDGLHPIRRFRSGISAYRSAVNNTSNFSYWVRR